MNVLLLPGILQNHGRLSDMGQQSSYLYIMSFFTLQSYHSFEVLISSRERCCLEDSRMMARGKSLHMETMHAMIRLVCERWPNDGRFWLKYECQDEGNSILSKNWELLAC
jgi:hypothetical protein